MSGRLYIIATPIGHLGDFSPHGVEILKQVDLIACENPGHSQRLLQHYQIQKPLEKVFEHNESIKASSLLKRLIQGQKVAYISDAGTPLISDPGYRLVRLAQQHHIQVIPIAGPCAAIAALSVAGLPTDRFVFEGFLPNKSNSRVKALKKLQYETRTLIFYESPHRILASLLDCAQVFGLMRLGVIARELTKQYETICQLPLGQLYQWAAQTHQDRGEMVLLIQGAEDKHQHHALHDMLQQLSSHLQGKQLVNVVHTLTGCPKQQIYQTLATFKNV